MVELLINVNLKVKYTKKVILLLGVYLSSILYIFPVLKNIGFLSLICLLISPIIMLIMQRRMYKDDYLYYIIVFASYNIFLLLRNINSNSIYYCILQILIVSSVLCTSSISIKFCNLKIFSRTCKNIGYILLFYNIILFALKEVMSINYDTYKFALKTVLYAMLLIGLYSEEYSSKKFYFRLIIYTFLFFVLRERTMAMGMLLIAIFYWIIGKIKKEKIYNLLYLIYVTSLLIFPFLYIGIYNSRYGIELNYLVAKYTHKNLFSGRHVIWRAVIEKIKDNVLLGCGIEQYKFLHSEIQMSAHNVYLFFLLQGGLISLGLVIVFFFILYKKMYSKQKIYINRISISILLAIMFLADFGLILFANDILYSVMLWTSVCIGLITVKCE